MDKNSSINVYDKDRELKTLGCGSNLHSIRVEKNEDILNKEEEFSKYDLVINLNNSRFKEWFDQI